MAENRLSYLFHRVVDGTASQTEKIELAQLSILPEYETQLLELMDEGWETFVSKEDIFTEIQSAAMIKKAVDMDVQTPKSAVPAHRIRLLKSAWLKYAAAIILGVGLGSIAYLWSINKKAADTFASDNKSLQTEIGPGGEKAILTLADGSKIILDTAANGKLATQGGVQVVKLANGQISYDLQGLSSKEIMWNTMATPKGGQYHVTLRDGTKVWLNAASSITFPTAFPGSERRVKVEGEIYFEVTPNKQKPFVVEVEGKSAVEVLGTSFNINSYRDEASIKTTLIEGSIKVIRGTMAGIHPSSGRHSNTSVILKPGQQAVVASFDHQAGNTAGITVQSDANLAQILAWKNGIFDFDGADLKTVMRQLERWYDIKVEYNGSVPEMTFEGKMYRNVNLSDVLDMFKEMGVHFKVKGNTLIVTD